MRKNLIAKTGSVLLAAVTIMTALAGCGSKDAVNTAAAASR